MNLWRALAIAACIAVIAGALLMALAVRVEPAPQALCMPDDEMRERVRAIMFKALDDGLHDHIARTFEVWMRDPRDQPDRAGVGVRQGIRAYVGARNVVNKWDPPKCETTSP